jgi:hypothetical protein
VDPLSKIDRVMKKFSLPKSQWFGAGLMLAALIVYGWAAQRGWHHPPTDAHSSRQAQTAITAQMLHEQGLSPLTPFNGLGPPWNVPMEFPTYQVLTAATAHLTGGDVVVAGRMVGILGTLLLLPALWLLARRAGLDFTGRSIAVALLLTTPLWMLFSRSVLIESWAAALALWWLAGLIETLAADRLDRRWLAATMLVGVLAALTKITSFAVLLPAGAIYTLLVWRRFGTARLWRSAMATLPAIAAALLWNHYADAAKYAHPFANFLTSENLSAWNWGTLEQRLDPDWWTRIGQFLQLIFPWWCAVFALAGLIWGTAAQRGALGLSLVVLISGPLAFANLYYVHNYYFMAVTPVAILVVAVGWCAIWQRWGQRRWGATILGIALVGVLGMQVQAYQNGLGRGQVRDRPLPDLGRLINELTSPNDRIIIMGQEWDPLLTYTIDRPLTFVRENYETDEDAWLRSRAAMAPADYTVLIAMDSVAGDTRFVHHRCRELGLLTDPIASTANADIYVSADVRDATTTQVEALKAAGRLLPARPDRMGPGESRIEFITSDWQPLAYENARGLFDVVQPLPTAMFSLYDPAKLPAFGQDVLHIHPPGGLRFSPLSRDRRITMAYGLRPEIWENQHDSDGVRFRFMTRAPGDRQRELWGDFVQPLRQAEDRKLLTVNLDLPADTELELWIDAGPDHNPGYDWSIIANLRIE